MAKIKSNLSFKNAKITFEEDGKVIIEEVTKDNTLVYNLLEEIKKFAGIDGISLSIGMDSEVEPLNE